MKNVILVKSHASVQLGHLYEHLFMMRLKTFMNEHGLYKSLDFAAWGMTYEQGDIIEINCGLYSDKKQAFAGEIARLRINLGERGEHVVPALRQIIAEEPFQLRAGDSKRLLAD